ncbi:putative protein kinase RLK-Pelle-CrRLK1L-1 family [Helianthus debilis subsp. tardiflorus]
MSRPEGYRMALKIPLSEIKDATKDFRNVIRRGSRGSIYEGELYIHGIYKKVAVMRSNEVFGEWINELLERFHLLAGNQHQNLITFFGYCDEGNEKIIVYEYAEHGSLARYIRCSDTNYTITWPERLKIVVDAARGLDHIHNHLAMNNAIIHGNIKSSNILLDHKWVAKISGLEGKSVNTLTSSTDGYVDPEYIFTGFMTKKSDVYSFGMVLFEVLCGRLCNVKYDDDIILSAEVAKEYYANDQLDNIIDPILRNQMRSKALKIFSAIAYKCLQNQKQRPLMDAVKKELEDTLKIEVQITNRL